MKAVIVGAGVCGPVTAMALQRAGIEAVVHEARPTTVADVGSYLTVATNGLDALMAIGAHAPVVDSSFPTPDAVLFSGTGTCLGRVPIGVTAREAAVSRTIRRAHLHTALHDEAIRRGIDIRFGHRLHAAETTPDGIIARFEDGSESTGDVMIGCDGVHSATRSLISADAPQPRYVGLLNFGGYTPRATVAPPGAWYMIFGKRAFFGYATDAAGGTVWFVNVPRHPASRHERESTSPDEWKRRLIDLFTDDRGPAAALISAGVLELAADNTHDLPFVPMWHRGRMIIIGDAAHAPSPTSGQGASMALEDAIVLAKCLRDCADVPCAFAAFERLRRRRVERIVAYGARGSSNKAVRGAARVLRDLLMPLVFRYLITAKSVAWLYEHHVDWQRPVGSDLATSSGERR